MNLKKIYCNGCSHTAGGGLETDRLLDENTIVRDYYKQKYGVYWETQLEVTYPKYISENLGVEFINEAASGGGSGRVVRMGYDFIKKNWDIKNELLLILEFPSSGRLDLYSKILKDFIILNLQFESKEIGDYNIDSITDLFGTRGYYKDEFKDDNKILSNSLKMYYENFFSRKPEFLKIGREINTFLSYLKYHKIKFIFFTGEFSSIIDLNLKEFNKLKLKVGKQIIEDFHEFAIQTKSTIAEECDFKTSDIHPGYFSHKNFGNLLSEYIIQNYEIF